MFLTMEVASLSETSVNLCQTTRRNIPEGIQFDTRRGKNLNSHLLVYIVS
jgi:hypothetical protein